MKDREMSTPNPLLPRPNTLPGWLLLCLLGVLGYGALVILYPRYSPALQWQYQLDRARAYALATEAAQSFGIETKGWTTQIQSNSDKENPINYYLSHDPTPTVKTIFSPFRTQIRFAEPRNKEFVTVFMNSAGRVTSVRRQPRANTSSAASETIQQEERPVSPAEQALADQAFRRLAGAESAIFVNPPVRTRNQGKVKHLWTAEFPADNRLKLQVEVHTQGNELLDASIIPNFSDTFRRLNENANSQTLQWLSRINGILLLPIGILCVLVFFINWGNGAILHRTALRFLALVFVYVFVTNYFGAFYEDLRVDVSLPMPWLTRLVVDLIFLLVIFFFVLPLYMFWAAGHSLAARLPQRRTIGVELLVEGRLNTRYLAETLLAGGLLGGLAAALPFCLKALPPFRASMFHVRDVHELFTVKAPALNAFGNDHIYGVVLFFTFLVPLIEYYVTRRVLARTLILVVGTFWLAGEDYFSHSAPAALLIGFGLTVLYYTIYRRIDLLATIVCSLSSMLALQALGLAAQPVPSLHRAAFQVALALGAILLAGAIGSWRGRNLPPETFAPLLQVTHAAERERLKADLEVASRAQQQMLPDEAPDVPGFDFAAVCKPSKDVGGDLYDFINLPDGRVGIVVADVSGKGVPAALYMTLTKGLLASISQEKSDPGEILREVNRHLYEACRKKVFVTLFLGVLDPVTRTLSYARAGHNPTVWRSPSQNKTDLLKPAGMGLGLNQGKLFNASLRVATLQLEPQDALFFYSDGITEAMNNKQEEYGEERLMAVAEKTDQLKANESRDRIMEDVKAFLGSLAPQDDQTLVVLKVL